MKRLHYNGSLSKDIKTTHSKFGPFFYFKENSGDFWFIIVIIVLMIVTKCISSLSIPTILACYSYNFYLLAKRYIKAREKFDKDMKEIKERFNELGEDLAESKKMRKMLKRSAVFDNVDFKEEMDRYVEHITSDIYYINSEDKIALLREVKTVYTFKDGIDVSDSDLYKLEENEMPQKNEIPVKQVLKLKNGIN